MQEVAGAVTVILLLGVTFLYKKFRLRSTAATESVAAAIPKPKARDGTEKEEEKPRAWKKISGVKTQSDSSQVSKEKSKEKQKPHKIEPLKEKVSTITDKPTEKISQLESKSSQSLNKGTYQTKIDNKAQPKAQQPSIAEKKMGENIPKEVKSVKIKRIVRPEIDEEKEALKFAEELKEAERKAEEEAKKHLRPIHLNIDKNARSKDDLQKRSEKEMELVKKLCGEMREIAKTTNPEEREERQKEIEKVRSAR